MANTYDGYEGFGVWHIDTDDILSFKVHDDPDSGFQPIWIDKIVFVPNGSGDGTGFASLSPSASPSLSVSALTVNVSSNKTITDTGSGAAFNGASVGDWMHIWKTSTNTNLGWYYIAAIDLSNNYVTIEEGTRPLDDASSQVYSMKFYTPVIHTTIISPTGASTVDTIETVIREFEGGKRFPNLGMVGCAASGYVHIYLK